MIIFYYFQSISPGLVETEMSAQFQFGELKDTAILQPVDIVDAVLFALSAPQRVNVSRLKFVTVFLSIFISGPCPLESNNQNYIHFYINLFIAKAYIRLSISNFDTGKSCTFP